MYVRNVYDSVDSCALVNSAMLRLQWYIFYREPKTVVVNDPPTNKPPLHPMKEK
jgi:hypothetical protein